MRFAGLLLLLLCSLPAGAQQTDANFAQAKSLFDRAMADTDLGRRASLLEQSLALVKTFEAAYALGNTQFDQKQFDRARRSYDQSLSLTGNPQALAAAYFKIGLVCEKTGSALEGIQWLRASLDRSPDDSVRRELKRIELAAAATPQTSQQLARAFTTGRALGSPKIDLQVRFAFNQSDLTAQGKSQSDGLGKLLADNPYDGFKFVLVGHTDEKGTEAYNDQLSTARADSVKRYIIERYSVAASRIATEGHGKREPLYPPGSDENDSLNRRVEVRLVPAR